MGKTIFKKIYSIFNRYYLLSINNTIAYLLKFCLIFRFNQNVSPLEHDHVKEEAQSRPKIQFKIDRNAIILVDYSI